MEMNLWKVQYLCDEPTENFQLNLQLYSEFQLIYSTSFWLKQASVLRESDL